MAKKDDSPDGFRFSRRNFLKTTSVVGFAESIVAADQAAAQCARTATVTGQARDW
jgi:hypothetical protein